MKILYSGIVSKKDGIHTISEFLEIMKKEFTHRVWRFDCSYSNNKYLQKKLTANNILNYFFLFMNN
jgi:hypothetical protein